MTGPTCNGSQPIGSSRWVDYEKFVTAVLPPESRLLRAYYYDSLPYISEAPTPEKTERLTKKERWLHAIEHLPQMCVRLGRVAMREDGTVVQKRVDVLLAMDMARVAYKKLVGVVVLAAGDSDYVPLVEVAKSEGLLVDLFYSDGNIHGDLIRACDRRHPINGELVEGVRMDGGGGTLGMRARRS
ncbi:MAG: NYN domain-containing protein [Firmicutes bacterium]|nr:NYN domain-containing protein [Bacillota bacterium]